MITMEENVERPTVRIENKRRKREESLGKNCEMNEDTWDNQETWERRDHELIIDHLYDAPVRLENEGWKLRMNKPELKDFG